MNYDDMMSKLTENGDQYMTEKIEYVQFTLDPNNPPTMTAEELARLDAMEIDYSDCAALPDDFFDKKK